jgi:hypothetical protein
MRIGQLFTGLVSMGRDGSARDGTGRDGTGQLGAVRVGKRGDGMGCSDERHLATKDI